MCLLACTIIVSAVSRMLTGVCRFPVASFVLLLLLKEDAHMSNIKLITRIGEGILAVAATGATVLVLQLAMLAA
jgi:hypothetical protein